MSLGSYVYPVNVTCPAGTAIATPLTTTPDLGDIWLDAIELRIPVGHHGLTGIYVANSGTAIMPYSSPPSFLVGDDERLSFDVGVEVDNLLQIVTYNTDIFNHTFYLRLSGQPMTLQQQGQTVAAPVAVVPVS